MTEVDQFIKRLKQDWLTSFCEARAYSPEGFDGAGLANLSANDARDFMQAIDCGLVAHHGGVFTAPQSKVKEQIFWEGARISVPRKITLWLEPIITIGALRRLQRDFQWPSSLLGMQLKTWAIDFVAYRSAHT